MKFTPSKAYPCIWLRKAPNLRCYEYIAVYVDGLCIVAESPRAIIDIFQTKYHLKVKGNGKLSYHLGADYFEYPDGTLVSQPKKYFDKLTESYKRLLNEDPPNAIRPLLTRMTFFLLIFIVFNYVIFFFFFICCFVWDKGDVYSCYK